MQALIQTTTAHQGEGLSADNEDYLTKKIYMHYITEHNNASDSVIACQCQSNLTI